MSGGIGGTRRFLGLSEPTWRILATGAVTAIWMLVAWTATAHANDCAAYVNDPKNFTGNLQGLIEDCMRTGYVQAIATLLIGGIGGGVIAVGVNKTLKDAGKNWKDPGGEAGGTTTEKGPRTVFRGSTCGGCGAPLPDTVTPGGLCPQCGEKNPLTTMGPCPKCGETINLGKGRCPFCKVTFESAPEPEPPPAPAGGTPEKPPADPGPRTVFRGSTCGGCGAPLPDTVTPGGLCPQCGEENKLTTMGPCPRCGETINLGKGRCPFCLNTFEPAPEPEPPPLAAEDPGPELKLGNCPNCGEGPIILARGRCPFCLTTFDPPGEAPAEPAAKTPAEPAQPKTEFASANCASCGAPLPGAVTPGAECPACGKQNPIKGMIPCPGCGTMVDQTVGICPSCKNPIEPLPPPEPPPKTTFEGKNCTGCGAPLPSTVTPGAECPACGKQNPITRLVPCPKCGAMFDETKGICPCGNISEPMPPPHAPPKTEFQASNCAGCGAPLPGAVTPGALCPACGKQNPIKGLVACPGCGAMVDQTVGICPACGNAFEPLPPPEAPPITGGTPRTPTGTTTPTGAGGTPTTGGGAAGPPAGGGSGGTGGTTPPAGTGGGTGGTATPPATASTSTPPAPDPIMDQQGVIKGNQAIDLLEESGLAKVTRDPSGKVTRIEEAYPGAFTDLGGKTVNVKTSESSGGGTGPDFVEQAKGKITGIGFKPNPDGSIGEPVIVVNHGESKWEQVPPSAPPPPPPPGTGTATAPPTTTTTTPTTTPPTAPGSTPAPGSGPATGPGGATAPPAPPYNPFQSAIDSAKEAADKLAQQAADAAKAAQQQYDDLRGKIEQADTARAMKAFGINVEALAKTMGVDPKQMKEILDMPDADWEKLKATISIPGVFLGQKPL